MQKIKNNSSNFRYIHKKTSALIKDVKIGIITNIQM